LKAITISDLDSNSSFTLHRFGSSDSLLLKISKLANARTKTWPEMAAAAAATLVATTTNGNAALNADRIMIVETYCTTIDAMAVAVAATGTTTVAATGTTRTTITEVVAAAAA